MTTDTSTAKITIFVHRFRLGHISLTRKIVSEMTYIVSSGTLNPTIPIPYHRFTRLNFVKG